MNEILQKRIEEAAKKICCTDCPMKIIRNCKGCVARENAIKTGIFTLQNQWISVDEALPEEEERVLVAHQHGCQVASLYKDSLRQYWGVAKESPIGADVTHWAEIPKFYK